MYTLFVMTGCPYCEKVERFFKKEEVVYTVRDIMRDSSAHDFLISKTGMTQVPYLEDSVSGIGLLESDDIIAYVSRAKNGTKEHGESV
jgi:glutaredoxin